MATGADVGDLLTTTATNQERVRGLLAISVPPGAIASVTGASVSSVRNWSAGAAEPRADAQIILDDLRTVAKLLLDSGLAPKRIGRWLMSRDTERFGGLRPIDKIVEDPMEVLAEAHDMTLVVGTGGGASVSTQHD